MFHKIVTKIINIIEIKIPVVILLVLVGSIGISVFFRYVLNNPIPELFEISTYSYVWLVYLGGALAVRYDQHIRFDILSSKFSSRTGIIIELVQDVITSAFMIIMFFPCLKYTFSLYMIKSSSLRIPWTFLLLCFPVFLLLCFYHLLKKVKTGIRRLSGGKEIGKEIYPWL